jgi:hypothetical protein
MGYLANGHLETLAVPGADATVTFRSVATWEDERELVRRSSEVAEGASEEDRAYAFRTARALLMIESWTLVDATGEPLPLEPEVLRRTLARHVATWIDREAERRFEGRPEGEEGPFGTRSPQPSTGTP